MMFANSPGTGFYRVGADVLGIATAGIARWQVNASGHIVAATDNSFDIGATGATRPRSVYAATSFVAPFGAAATPSIVFDTETTTGLYRVAANVIGFSTAGVGRWKIDASGHLMAVTDASFDIGALAATRPRNVYLSGQIGIGGDVLLERDAAAVLGLRNGTNAQTFRVYNTESASLVNYERVGVAWSGNVCTVKSEAAGTGAERLLAVQSGLTVEAIATGVAETLTVGESGKLFTNTGATARQDFNLPAAVVGLRYRFYVADTDGVRVVANGADTIRLAGSVSAGGGRIDSANIGDYVVLVVSTSGTWVAETIVGTWTVT